MTISEMQDILKKKMLDTKAMLESADNGNKLMLKAAISFMDKNCNEAQEFVMGTHTMLLGTIFVRSLENSSDEDPEFSYSIAAMIDQNGEIDESLMENEYLEFDSRVYDFIKRLKNCTNIESLITSEAAMIEEDSKNMMRMVEDRLNNLKKGGFWVTVAICLLMLAITAIKIAIIK